MTESGCEGFEAVAAVQASHALANVVAVSLTPEAIPSTRQRTIVSSLVDHDRLRIALVGGGRALRVVVKAFSLFFPRTRAFSLDEVDEALRFVGTEDLVLARRDLAELAAPFDRRVRFAG